MPRYCCRATEACNRRVAPQQKPGVSLKHRPRNTVSDVEAFSYAYCSHSLVSERGLQVLEAEFILAPAVPENFLRSLVESLRNGKAKDVRFLPLRTLEVENFRTSTALAVAGTKSSDVNLDITLRNPSNSVRLRSPILIPSQSRTLLPSLLLGRISS